MCVRTNVIMKIPCRLARTDCHRSLRNCTVLSSNIFFEFRNFFLDPKKFTLFPEFNVFFVKGKHEREVISVNKMQREVIPTIQNYC